MSRRMLYVALSLFIVHGVALSSEIRTADRRGDVARPAANRSGGDVKSDYESVVNARTYGAAGDNTADDGLALQASIDKAVTTSGIVLIPKGVYKYSSTLIIDNAIIVRGAGSSEHGSYSPGQTVLYYIGTGPAIKIKGTGPEGKENIHISDLAIIGTAAAEGGILAGSDGPVHKSSFKNLLVAGFTKTASDNMGYGFRADNLYTSIIENVYAHRNRDGFNIYGHATTLHFINTNSRSNNRYGYRIQYLSGSKFFGSMAEDNHDTGLCISTRNGGYTFHNDFYGYYSEANYLKSVVITATGTGVTDIVNFFGGSIQERYDKSVARIQLDRARWIWFNGTGIPEVRDGYISVTVNTKFSGFRNSFNAQEATSGAIWDTATGIPNFEHTDFRHWGPVKFPAKFHAASDSSTLDDYREGTWTPVYSDNAVGGHLATGLVENHGYYTKTGNMVTIWGGVTGFSTAGMKGNNALYIHGLPFTAAAFSVGIVRVQNMSLNRSVPLVVISKGNNYLNLSEMADNAPATNSRVNTIDSGSTSLHWTITYRTDQ